MAFDHFRSELDFSSELTVTVRSSRPSEKPRGFPRIWSPFKVVES